MSAARLWVAGESAALAQLVEHIIRNDGATGSSPVSGTTSFSPLYQYLESFRLSLDCPVNSGSYGVGQWNRVPGSVSGAAILRKSPCGSLTPEYRATSCRCIFVVWASGKPEKIALFGPLER